jgi:hypothetical protein
MRFHATIVDSTIFVLQESCLGRDPIFEFDDDDSLISSVAEIIKTFLNEKRKHGGSIPGHIVIYRDREGGHDRMFKDYLAENPTYGPKIFRRRFLFFHFELICCMFINIIVVVKLWFCFLGTGCLGIFSYV